ncbi:MAG TPA: radical SAM protein [Tepidisphaeraceae bacterium]|jgi:wyosine [tRNA(Phe)-imidazoG37] synthetase (radical SAM superfamily)
MPILPLFTQHSRHWQQNRYVYPVISRRSRGLSIGVNLNPDKVCNFDCVYCCVDRTQPPTIRDVDLDVLREELDHLLGLAISGELFQQPPFDQTPPNLRRINDVAFSGDGEPTSFQQFGEACRIAVELIERRARPDIKIVIITNATLFHQKRVAEALAYLDEHDGEIWAKLDAGTQAYYRLIERTSIPLRRVLDNILAAGRVRPIVIQALFLQLNGKGPPPGEIDAFVERLKELVAGGCRIKLVQVYTIARETAVAECTPLPAAELDAISELVRRETGLAVETYYGPS